jgi:hypothetical protein
LSTSSEVSLGSLRLQSQQRSDLENNPFVSTPEWNMFLSQSYKELYDKLVGAYGNDYYVAQAYQFNTSNAQFYPLPNGTPTYQNVDGGTAAKFYKLLGVDLQYSASPSGWVTLRRFEMIERNKYAYPNTQVNWNGYTNMRYRLQGNNLYIVPIPMTGQLVQVWYIPAPTNLQFQLPSETTLLSPNVTLSDTTGLTVGMNVSGLGVPDGTTLLTVASTSVTMSANALSSRAQNTLSFWNDSTLMEGISGWDEYVILSAAIKAQIKQEGDISGLAMQLKDVNDRVEALAEGRDAGQAFHVSDALGAGGYGDGFGGGGFDGSWF